MNVTVKVVGALILVLILISALFTVSSGVINSAGEKGQNAGNTNSEILDCVTKNSDKDNAREWCKENMNYGPEVEVIQNA